MSTEGASRKVEAGEVSRRMEEMRLGVIVSVGWLRVKPEGLKEAVIGRPRD